MSGKRVSRSILELDPIQSLVEGTVLNPLLTIPLFLATRLRPETFSRYSPLSTLSGVLAVAGISRWLSTFLSDRASNNSVHDTYDWTKEVVVITGGSSGIGAAIVQQLRAQNIKLVIIDRNEPTSIDESISFYRCDLASPEQIRDTTSAIQKNHGDPTVLINVAGTWNKTPLLETSYEATSHLFAVNVFAQFELIKAFAPAMAARNHGMIVTTSSAIAYGTSPPAMVDYAATKSALVSLHESVGAELSFRYNAPKIRMVLVIPGFTNTPLTAGLRRTSLIWPAIEPEELAKAVVKQVLSGRGGTVVVPKSLSWTDMTVRVWPAWMRKIRSGQPTIART